MRTPARGYAVDARTGKASTIAVGKVRLRDRPKPKGDPNFNNLKFGRLRVKEITKVADSRYPGGIPEVDIEDDGFLFCTAHALFLIRRSEVDFDTRLHAWIETRMPWARDRAQQLIDKFRARFNLRSCHLRARTVAKFLNIKEFERRELRLTTIAVAGLTASEYETWLYEDEKRRDRERKAKARAAAGSIPREDWLKINSAARERPWEANGQSKASHYRSKPTSDAGPSAHGETGCSATGETRPSEPIESVLASDGPVSNALSALSLYHPETVAGAASPPVSRQAKTSGRKPASADQLTFIDQLSQGAKS